MWAKERRKMAKKAADADGGSRATKSSVHWMVVSDDFENWEARFVLPMDITAEKSLKGGLIRWEQAWPHKNDRGVIDNHWAVKPLR